jgi:hypothetical protein
MATSKSVSRKPAAKKAAKTRKPLVTGKKAAATPKQRIATKKAAAIHRMKTPASTAFERRLPSESLPAVVEIDNQIAVARANLRALVEQATSSSGAADEELMSQRIAEQEAKLALLRKQREEFTS